PVPVGRLLHAYQFDAGGAVDRFLTGDAPDLLGPPRFADLPRLPALALLRNLHQRADFEGGRAVERHDDPPAVARLQPALEVERQAFDLGGARDRFDAQAGLHGPRGAVLERGQDGHVAAARWGADHEDMGLQAIGAQELHTRAAGLFAVSAAI